jgi:selenocysteine-specific elongation factor
VTSPGWLVPTAMLTVKLHLLPYIHRPLRHNAYVSFFTGAAEAVAKVRLLDAEELKPGESAWAQLSLDKSVALVKGDRFIVRSPMETVGGGEIIDAHARRLRRFRPTVIDNLEAREQGTAEDVIMALLEAKQPQELSALASQSNLLPDEAQSLAESLIQQGLVISIGQGERRLLFTADGWERLAGRVEGILQDYHRRFPARSGMPRVELGGRLGLGSYAPAALKSLSSEGAIVEDGDAVRLAGHQIKLTPAQQAKVDDFLQSLARNPYAPPGELIPEPELLNLLVEQRKVVKVSEGVAFSASAYDEMVEKVTSYIKEHGKVSLAEVRDLFKTSRKYAQALLEHMDSKRITRRVGDERVLR